MLVSVAENTTLVAAFGFPAVVFSQEIDMGQNNYGGLTVVADVFLNMGGTGALDVQVQGSNDGRNWIDISGFNVGLAAAAVGADNADIPLAQVRLKYTLTVAGDAGDWCAVTFDAKLNLVQK